MLYPNECPECKVSLVGELVYEHFLRIKKNETEALEIAKQYGATKTAGYFNRAISIYDRNKDRTVAFSCPDCNHRWDRFFIDENPNYK